MFLNTRKLFLGLFVILSSLGLTLMGFATSATESSKNIRGDAMIIDVRTSKEFADNSNPESINIPLDELESKLATLDKEKTLIVCCASGRRSAIAAALLKKNGFANVVDAGSWRNTLS